MSETFFERKLRVEVVHRRGTWSASRAEDAGHSTTTRDFLSAWCADDGRVHPLEVDAASVEARLSTLARALVEGAGDRASGLDLQLRAAFRKIVHEAGSVRRESLQQWVLVELRAHATRAGEARMIQREAAFGSIEDAERSSSEITALIEEAATSSALRLDDIAAPDAELPVVLPPGADAGVFFHEVLGHPLEGDVVARKASYLSERLGERVGGPHLTVVDDPTCGPGAVTYAFDDEGTPARAAVLVREGVVHEPIVDRRTASLIGVAPNGHGRRASFRHPALPRMTHTEVRGHRGTFEELAAPIEDGVLVRYLTPRYVNLWTGDFSFYVVEARALRGGVPGPFLKPCLLRGNGLDALAALDAAGADVRRFFGLKGCGKLDQGDLPVSFGNPSVRFRRLRIEPHAG